MSMRTITPLPPLSPEYDEHFMREAMVLAKRAYELDESPVGCVVVRQATLEIIGRGWNTREGAKDPLGHAELMAISEAAKNLGGWRLVDCAIYCTLEPCMMCTGAILQARPQLLVYGAKDRKGYLSGELVNPKFPCRGGVLEAECQKLLNDFFQNMRSKNER